MGPTKGVAAEKAAGQLAGVRQRFEEQRPVPGQPNRQAADGQDAALQPVLELRLEGCVRLRQAVVVHGSAHVLRHNCRQRLHDDRSRAYTPVKQCPVSRLLGNMLLECMPHLRQYASHQPGAEISLNAIITALQMPQSERLTLTSCHNTQARHSSPEQDWIKSNLDACDRALVAVRINRLCSLGIHLDQLLV